MPKHLDLNIAATDVRLRAPDAVIDTLAPMLSHVARTPAGVAPELVINVFMSDDVWHIGGSSPQSVKALGGASSLPQVAGTAISAALTELANHRGFELWRAAVVERNGYALALVGDDWESGVVLTTHLHTRGWRIIAGDCAVVSRDGLVAYPFRRALHANSASTDAFPRSYRPAVEVSPWYATAHVIAFYAIDPTRVEGGAGWGDAAPIRAVLRLDGHIADDPALEAGENFDLSEHLRSSDLSARGVAAANLIIGELVETCDFLEAWFSSVCAGVEA